MANELAASEPVHISQAHVDKIIRHALEGHPEEVCGVIRGRDAHTLEVVRGRNIAEDRTVNYTVDPQTLLLQFAFEDDGDEMIGIYHSHPASEAYPSATDAWNAGNLAHIWFYKNHGLVGGALDLRFNCLNNCQPILPPPHDVDISEVVDYDQDGDMDVILADANHSGTTSSSSISWPTSTPCTARPCPRTSPGGSIPPATP